MSMQKAINPLITIFKINSKFTLDAMGDISEADIIRRPDDKANSMHFILGHMLATRFYILEILGKKEKWQWYDLFVSGAELVEAGRYPGIGQLKSDWNICSEKLISLLEAVPEEKLLEKAPFAFPLTGDDLLGSLSFLAMHESNHLGQIIYLRRLFGYPPYM